MANKSPTTLLIMVIMSLKRNLKSHGSVSAGQEPRQLMFGAVITLKEKRDMRARFTTEQNHENCEKYQYHSFVAKKRANLQEGSHARTVVVHPFTPPLLLPFYGSPEGCSVRRRESTCQLVLRSLMVHLKLSAPSLVLQTSNVFFFYRTGTRPRLLLRLLGTVVLQHGMKETIVDSFVYQGSASLRMCM